jgi:hydantoinase/carbamoylase family amidase
MARLTLDESDVKARKWFGEEMEKVGCSVKVDAMGNMFAVRPGKERTGAPIAMGSHLDTQPTGGRYDGILGMMAAVEAMRTIHESGFETNNAIAAVNWTNEEGARFPKSLCGSAVWAQLAALEDAYALKDVLGDAGTMGDALRQSGYLGSSPCSHEKMPLKAHFELHIEQGPILEDAQASIGVVQGAQAYRWIDVTVNGRECHTGTTPLHARADALLATSQVIVKTHALAKQHRGLASVGVMTVMPGSVNTCPGTVKFVLDVRHPTDKGKEDLIDAIYRSIQELIQSNSKLSFDWSTRFDSKAVKFDARCIDAVRQAARAHFGPEADAQVLNLISGAGHDSCATSWRCPTAMIFVPSKDALSHHPREFTSAEHCALGAQVLLDAVLRYDAS